MKAVYKKRRCPRPTEVESAAGQHRDERQPDNEARRNRRASPPYKRGHCHAGERQTDEGRPPDDPRHSRRPITHRIPGDCVVRATRRARRTQPKTIRGLEGVASNPSGGGYFYSMDRRWCSRISCMKSSSADELDVKAAARVAERTAETIR